MASVAQWRQVFEGGFAAELELIVDDPQQVGSGEGPVQWGDAVINCIDSVEADLLLVSAYFIPTDALMAALDRAVRRGVRVRVLTNSLGSNNHVSAHAAYTHHRRALLMDGVELYELRADASERARYIISGVEDSMLGLHAKFAVLDDCCIAVGSSNFDPRSLLLNSELGAFAISEPLNAELRYLFAVDMAPGNAWRVSLDDAQRVIWSDEAGHRYDAPPASFFLRAENWFFGLLPLDGQM